MNDKNDKKKESIDDILSDLNGLLNKMPSILDGIKMPEIKPVEFEKPEQAVRPEPPPAKTHQSGGDLPPRSEDKASPGGPETFDGDKTIVIDSLSSLPEGSSVPLTEPEDAAVQGPVECITEENSVCQQSEPQALLSSVKLEGSPLEPPEARVKNEAPQSASLFISALTPPMKAPDTYAEGSVEASLEVQPREDELFFQRPEAGFMPESDKQENFSGLPVAGLTSASDPFADFVIPDIDALLQLSEGKLADKPGVALSPQACEPALPPAAVETPDEADLLKFEQQLANIAPEETDMDSGKINEDSLESAPLTGTSEPVTNNEVPQQDLTPFAGESPAPMPVLDLSEPEKEEADVVQPKSDGPDFGSFPQENFAAAPAAVEIIMPEPALDASAGSVELPPPPAPSEAENTIEFSNGAAPALPEQWPAPEPEPTLTIGNTKDGPLAAPSLQADGDKTMVIDTHGSGAAEEEKTVIYQAPVMAGLTSRAKISDLADLSGKSAPEGIPAERIRSLIFLYAPEDGVLCANLLSEIDAVCLRSQASPMFIKRAGVNVFDSGMNANFVLQAVADSAAVGLVSVGGIPQEKVYEIENAFSSAGVYFRHFDSESFTHSSVLDMLLELILR